MNAVVIPAAMHTALPSSTKTVQRQTSAQSVTHVKARFPEYRIRARAAIAARWRTGDDISPAAATNVSLKQGDLAASQTLLIIRTTQQVGPNSWVWSVGVWRVNVVTPVQGRSEAAPVTKKT